MIESPNFNVWEACGFVSVSGSDIGLNLARSIDPVTGQESVLVGPPQPITYVSCYGTCVNTGSECSRNGIPVAKCCTGYCADGKCRPWV